MSDKFYIWSIYKIIESKVIDKVDLLLERYKLRYDPELNLPNPDGMASYAVPVLTKVDRIKDIYVFQDSQEFTTRNFIPVTIYSLTGQIQVWKEL